MLNDFTGADQVYIACGYTDLRKGIDGLARLVQQQFALDPFTMTLHQGGAYQTHGLLNPMFTLRATVWMMRRSGRMGRGVRHHHCIIGGLFGSGTLVPELLFSSARMKRPQGSALP